LSNRGVPICRRGCCEQAATIFIPGASTARSVVPRGATLDVDVAWRRRTPHKKKTDRTPTKRLKTQPIGAPHRQVHSIVPVRMDAVQARLISGAAATCVHAGSPRPGSDCSRPIAQAIPPCRRARQGRPNASRSPRPAPTLCRRHRRAAFRQDVHRTQLMRWCRSRRLCVANYSKPLTNVARGPRSLSNRSRPPSRADRARSCRQPRPRQRPLLSHCCRRTTSTGNFTRWCSASRCGSRSNPTPNPRIETSPAFRLSPTMRRIHQHNRTAPRRHLPKRFSGASCRGNPHTLQPRYPRLPTSSPQHRSPAADKQRHASAHLFCLNSRRNDRSSWRS